MRHSVPFNIFSSETIVTTFDDVFGVLEQSHTKIIFSSRLRNDIKIAFVEAVANAVKHARELENFEVVEGRLFLDDRVVGFEVYDHGRGFDLASVPPPNLGDFAASGRGLFMMQQLGDVVTYRRSKKHNTLVFKRHLIGHSASSRELDFLYELSEAIVGKTCLDEVYQIILDQALELFHVERASILIFDESVQALRVAASRGISGHVQKVTAVRPGDGVSGYVYQHGRPLLIEDVARNKRGIEKKGHYKTASFISAPMICSPLRLEEKPMGVINLTDRVDGRRFTKKDLKLLSTIANQAMACVYIRGLVDEIKEKERLKKEMEQVSAIQGSYLPTQAPVVSGYDIWGRCEMAQSVGGDYFDYIVSGGKLFLVVADVSGHDTSSAVTMVNFRSQLRAFISVCDGPGEILSRLNAGLYDDLTAVEQFVSCLLLCLNPANGHVVFANAGHYPPLFSRFLLASHEGGLVLGVEKGETYGESSFVLPEGETLLLYTDGVVEASSKQGDVFGFDRLKTIVADHDGQPSRDLVMKIIESVLVFRTNNQLLDDVTVVAVTREACQQNHEH